MINIDFLINDKNNIRRIDSNPIISASSNYLCNFTFQGEQWEDIEKYVIFKTSKNKTYTASLGTEMEASSPIPSAVLAGCLMKVSVYGGDLITTNEISVVIIPTGYTPDISSSDSEFKDAFADAYRRIEQKFDNAVLEDDNIIAFYAKDKKIATINLNPLLESQQSDWNEQDSNSPHFIKNKPRVITDGIFYKDTYILKLYDNTNLAKEISLKHSHKSDDIVDLDFDVDIDEDLNQLLINLTQNIRSL